VRHVEKRANPRKRRPFIQKWAEGVVCLSVLPRSFSFFGPQEKTKTNQKDIPFSMLSAEGGINRKKERENVSKETISSSSS
jgi:hypothetical protein